VPLDATVVNIPYGEMRTEQEKDLDQQIKTRILSGMRLLQAEYGEDWVDHIDLARLNLRSGSSCVLGQLYDGYGCGLKELNLRDTMWATINYPGSRGHAEDFGFTIRELDSERGGMMWDMLQEEWYEAIEELQAGR
jgi:hypothetical protein